MNVPEPLRYIIAGRLNRDYLVLPGGEVLLEQPGGSLLYAASGLALWEQGIGIIGRVGEDYPRQWLEQATLMGLDQRGIHILPEPVDLRSFTGYAPQNLPQQENPVSHFARLGLPFPKALLDYRAPTQQLDSRVRLTTLAIRVNDIPSDYLDASSAHLCSLEYLEHSLLPSTFRQGHITTITLDAGQGYMDPTYWDGIPSILSGLTAFHTTEKRLRNLFQGRTSDLWEMASALARYGCELIVIRRGEEGQLLYDQGGQCRWQVPAYPAQVINPTGCGDSLCGGFLAGYRRTYDPLQALLYGNISASFTLEGRQAYYTMQALPRLAEARLDVLQGMVRRV